MKKFILFPLYLLIIGLLSIDCYNNPKQSNKTKARLQKKLKEKQKVQVNKVDE